MCVGGVGDLQDAESVVAAGAGRCGLRVVVAVRRWGLLAPCRSGHDGHNCSRVRVDARILVGSCRVIHVGNRVEWEPAPVAVHVPAKVHVDTVAVEERLPQRAVLSHVAALVAKRHEPGPNVTVGVRFGEVCLEPGQHVVNELVALELVEQLGIDADVVCQAGVETVEQIGRRAAGLGREIREGREAVPVVGKVVGAFVVAG